MYLYGVGEITNPLYLDLLGKKPNPATAGIAAVVGAAEVSTLHYIAHAVVDWFKPENIENVKAATGNVLSSVMMCSVPLMGWETGMTASAMHAAVYAANSAWTAKAYGKEKEIAPTLLGTMAGWAVSWIDPRLGIPISGLVAANTDGIKAEVAAGLKVAAIGSTLIHRLG